jgi:hypothetical protein
MTLAYVEAGLQPAFDPCRCVTKPKASRTVGRAQRQAK